MINYYAYHDMTERLFYGVALTDEHMNKATTKIAKYLNDGGANSIVDALGICIQERERNGKIYYRRMVYRLTGEELSIKEICNLGLFLPYGAYYGQYNVPRIEARA